MFLSAMSSGSKAIWCKISSPHASLTRKKKNSPLYNNEIWYEKWSEPQRNNAKRNKSMIRSFGKCDSAGNWRRSIENWTSNIVSPFRCFCHFSPLHAIDFSTFHIDIYYFQVCSYICGFYLLCMEFSKRETYSFSYSFFFARCWNYYGDDCRRSLR